MRGEESNDEDGQIKSIKTTGCSRMLSKQTKNSNKANNSTIGGLEEPSTDLILTEMDAQVSLSIYDQRKMRTFLIFLIGETLSESNITLGIKLELIYYLNMYKETKLYVSNHKTQKQLKKC